MNPLLLSAFVAPGAGQLYRKEFLKGILLLGLCLLGFAWLCVDLCSIVEASLNVEPFINSPDIVQRAVKIEQSFSIYRLKIPVSMIAVSYFWSILDLLWSMLRERRSSQLDAPNDPLE